VMELLRTETGVVVQGGLFRIWEDYFRTRRVAIGDGPLSGRIGFAYSTYRKRTVERVLYHRVLSL